MPPSRRFGFLASTVLSSAVWAGLLTPSAVRAQQAVALDEISVTSPSPIQPSRSAVAADAAVPIGVLPVATNTFSPVTVVTQDQIARDQPRTLGDALFDRPGISGTTYAPGAASRPIIRGLDNARVRIQENGIVNGGVSDLGEDHAVPVNPLVADRIEVIRGPATLRYGSGAIGGVVSADNNRVPTFIPANGVQGQVTSGYSTVDNGRLGAATVDAGSDGIAVHADGFKTAADSYAIPGGIQRNSYNESQGGAVGISAIGDRGFVGISFSHYDAIYAIPGGVAEQDRTRLTPNQDRVLSRGEYRPLDGPFEVIRYWAGYSVYRHNEVGIGEDGIEGVQAIFKNREAEGRLELQHVPVFTEFGTLTGALADRHQERHRVRDPDDEIGYLIADGVHPIRDALDSPHARRLRRRAGFAQRHTATATRTGRDGRPLVSSGAERTALRHQPERCAQRTGGPHGARRRLSRALLSQPQMVARGRHAHHQRR